MVEQKVKLQKNHDTWHQSWITNKQQQLQTSLINIYKVHWGESNVKMKISTKVLIFFILKAAINFHLIFIYSKLLTFQNA